MIKHLNGLLQPSSGRVLLDDLPLNKHGSREVLSRVGIVFQDPNDQLFAATVAEDIAFGPFNMGLTQAEVKQRVEQALKQVNIEELAGKSIHALSHGQRKRVCVAGVLAMQPQVIVLDEPTAGLDPMGVHALMLLLKELNEKAGITMIMATHVVDLVPLFMSKIAILSHGRILRQGAPEEILGDPATMEKAKLNLPLVAELMHILKTRDNLKLHHIPLTVGEARREILRLLTVQDVVSRV
jgi:cobalt/nickel transport system ATP-binding protein